MDRTGVDDRPSAVGVGPESEILAFRQSDPVPPSLDENQVASRRLRDLTKDKSYRAYPLGEDAAAYLRHKRGVLTKFSYRNYEAILAKLALDHLDLRAEDFEPPVGSERIEEFLDRRWGDSAPSTYNLSLQVLHGFFEWLAIKGKIHGVPTLGVPKRKKRAPLRETFTEAECEKILVSQNSLRDKIACRLLLHYGIRKGGVRSIQFKHFDHNRRLLSIFTKGEKWQTIPIPGEFRKVVGYDQDRDEPLVQRWPNPLWQDLERYILEIEAQPEFFLMHSERTVWRGYDDKGDSKHDRLHFHDRQMSDGGMHKWWYACLERAGLVEKGQQRGKKMHNARHTTAQRVLEGTGGNYKAAQVLLGHSSAQTTLDIYSGWGEQALSETLNDILGSEEVSPRNVD